MDILDTIPPAKAERGDYIQDGLMYCGKCKTPKEFLLQGIARPIMCYCTETAYNDGISRYQAMSREGRLRDNIKASGIESKFILSQWSDIVINKGNEEPLKEIRHWLDNFDNYAKQGQGLLLFGGVGTGKTMIASIIGNELLSKGKTVMFLSVLKLMNRGYGYEHQEENEEFDKRVERFGLLIFDDLGAERSTPAAKEKVISVLNNRYVSGKPMVVTTNLSMSELCGSKDIENDRIIDRCIEVCYGVEFKGESYRKTIAKINRNEFKQSMQ